eukprot:scaffold91_cov254-Pinguiococcus_pyrenoidosus.AAC.24
MIVGVVGELSGQHICFATPHGYDIKRLMEQYRNASIEIAKKRNAAGDEFQQNEPPLVRQLPGRGDAEELPRPRGVPAWTRGHRDSQPEVWEACVPEPTAHPLDLDEHGRGGAGEPRGLLVVRASPRPTEPMLTRSQPLADVSRDATSDDRAASPVSVPSWRDRTTEEAVAGLPLPKKLASGSRRTGVAAAAGAKPAGQNAGSSCRAAVPASTAARSQAAGVVPTAAAARSVTARAEAIEHHVSRLSCSRQP